MLMRHLLLWLANNSVIRRLVLRSGIARTLAHRFVAGERVRDALDVAHELNKQGIAVSLDYLGENVTSASAARSVAQTYIDLFFAIKERGLNCNVSLKLTALGLDIDRELCRTNLIAILDTARACRNFVRIDMESSAYTQVTLDIWEEIYNQPGYDNTGIVLQSYLYRSTVDVERAIQLRARVRLCKGAYDEPKEVAFPRKADVDRNYLELARRLLDAGNYPGLATHDSILIEQIKGFVQEHAISNSRFEFQMLYGVRRDLQRDLRAEGYNLRVYVPFGEAWYPYLMRRMAERPANLLFVLRALRHG